MPVSENEKHGVSTSDCRYNDKVENIPIKKRRFVSRPPSPAPVKISPCAEETANHTKCFEISDKPSEMIGQDEDFSGISILAAAACSSSLGGECGSAEDALGIEESSKIGIARKASNHTEAHTLSKGRSNESVLNSSEMSSGATSSCISTEPVGELASISTTVNSSQNCQKISTIGEVLEEAPLGVHSLTLSGDVACTKEELARKPRVSSRDQRLHWDLNVVMDAWEQPFDNSNAQDDVSHSLSEDPSRSDNSDNVKTGGLDLLESSETVSDSELGPLPGEPGALTSQSKGNCNLEHPLVLNDKTMPSNSNCNFDELYNTGEDTKDKHHGDSVKRTVTDDMTLVLASCTMIESVGAPLKSLNIDDECSAHQSLAKSFESNIGVPSLDLQNIGNTGASDTTFGGISTNADISLCISSNADTVIEREPNFGARQGLEPPKMLHHEEKDHVDNVDVKMVVPLKHTEFSISNDHGLSDTKALYSIPKRSSEFQEGYDSQYEDGELRESSGRAWDECDREADHVVYFSKYKESCSVDANDYRASDSGPVLDQRSRSLGAGRAASFGDYNVHHDDYVEAADEAGNDERYDDDNQSKMGHVKEKTELQEEELESSKSFSDMANRCPDVIRREDKMPSHHIDRPLDSEGTESRNEPRAFRRGLQSQVEGPMGCDDISRDEQVNKLGNRFNSGSMRSFERFRCSFQDREREGASWDALSDSRRGFRRHYSPIIRGNHKLNDDAVVDRDELGCIDTPDDDFNSRFKADRKFSPDRVGGFGRGRPFRNGPFGESRGRGRYNGPSPDEVFQSSLKHRRPLSRRERSLSPFRGRGQSNMHTSRRKSLSHSRSRSPIIWNSSRGRLAAGSGGGNVFLRHRSRSPNFRSEARIQRPRSPHQPGFGVDHAGGFRPISRNHGSPPRRWASVRNEEMGHYREIGYKQRTRVLDRSPGRIRLRGDRGSDVDSPRSLKPDGFYRMSARVFDDAGRGGRYEENYDDRRKQYKPFFPTRHNYDDDVNDGFSMPNCFQDRGASSFQGRGLRSINNRLNDQPRRVRGENHSYMYERERKFNNDSKQFGLDGMDSSHNPKSYEHYHPYNTGRYSEVIATNRGSRFENYEDRRKHYSATSIMRHSDNEDTKKRLVEDENIEDTCGKIARGVDGRIGSLSTRFRENDEPVMCGQKEKPDDNPQPIVQNSDENDATRVVTA